MQVLADFPLGDPTKPIMTQWRALDDEEQRRVVDGLVSLGSDFERFAAALKGHARDKVFATLGFFGTSCNILPDYRTSEFQLALKILREGPSSASTGGGYLELTKHLCANLRTAPYT